MLTVGASGPGLSPCHRICGELGSSTVSVGVRSRVQCADTDDDSVVVLDNVDVRPRLVVALADDEMSRCNMLSASECVAGVFMLCLGTLDET